MANGQQLVLTDASSAQHTWNAFDEHYGGRCACCEASILLTASNPCGGSTFTSNDTPLHDSYGKLLDGAVAPSSIVAYPAGNNTPYVGWLLATGQSVRRRGHLGPGAG
jgi:hypothetical protein